MSARRYVRGRGAARVGVFATTALLIVPGVSHADTMSLFGDGPRAAGLARADLALAGPPDAPRQNAALASAPGIRVRIGYGYAGLHLTLNGADAGVEHASGVDLAAQLGTTLSDSASIGMAFALHLPDQHLARVGFRPATEPQFVFYEASLQRTAVDVVGALRFRWLSLGVGVSAGLSVGGAGTRFDLGQTAQGTFADAGLDVALPYHLAPIVGAQADLGRVAIGASFRGAQGIDLQLDNVVQIHLNNNPLNGSTTVKVRGPSGVDPATFALGARVAVGLGFSAIAAIEYAAYHEVPPPIADVHLDVDLGVTPALREARFIAPRFRDTLTPRLGVELRWPVSEPRWVARAGYAFAPSPVPAQQSFTSHADAARHALAIGGGYRFARIMGVDLALNLALQLHLLAPRVEEKSPVLPFAHYEVGGRIIHGSGALEATWR